MKKLLFLLAILAGTTAMAQRQIQLTIDYTQGIYDGRTYRGIQEAEDDFLKDQPRYESRLMEGLSDHLTTDVVFWPDSVDADKPELHILIIAVDRKGNIKAQATLTQGTDSRSFSTTSAKGGVFGSWLNLFGDGMHSLGKQLAAWLNTQK